MRLLTGEQDAKLCLANLLSDRSAEHPHPHNPGE